MGMALWRTKFNTHKKKRRKSMASILYEAVTKTMSTLSIFGSSCLPEVYKTAAIPFSKSLVSLMKMGIKGLLQLINENKDSVCTKAVSLKGKLIIDGNGVLHELYESNHLEWSSGGCYADQHKLTVDFFTALTSSGVQPVVIMGGVSKTYLDHTIFRRNQSIQDMPEQLEKCHLDMDHPKFMPHHLPLLAREVFATSLKGIDVPVYVADGQAHNTAVSLANHYKCPVLTNNTNYCVCGIAGGVIILDHLDITNCKATIYKQTMLDSFLKLSNPNLIFVIIAIMGDNSDTSVPYLYYGRIKREILSLSRYSGEDLSTMSKFLSVLEFLKDRNIKSLPEFQRRIQSFNFGGLGRTLAKNCRVAQKTYDLSSSTVSIEAFEKSTSMEWPGVENIPKSILKSYRVGECPFPIMNAIVLGECTLYSNVGDPEQPPLTVLGLPIRQVMYGLAASLMSQDKKCVTEYYRSDNPPWKYQPHSVEPVYGKYKEISVDKIYDLDVMKREELTKSAICEILQSPADALSILESDLGHVYVLASLTTHYWAKSLLHSQHLPHPDQLIKALVLNFIFSRGENQEKSGCSLYSDPMWIKVYHAILEWQSLYRDVCSLNFMLCSPFLELPPTNILDAPFVMELALNPSPDVILTYHEKLGPEKKDLFTKIVSMINI